MPDFTRSVLPIGYAENGTKLNGETIANNVVNFADAVKGKIANSVASIRNSVASFAAAA